MSLRLWYTSTLSQVSNFDDVVLKIYYGPQILETTGVFDQQTSYIQNSYLTLWPIGLDNYIVCKSFAVHTLLGLLEFVIHNKSQARGNRLNLRLFYQLPYL